MELDKIEGLQSRHLHYSISAVALLDLFAYLCWGIIRHVGAAALFAQRAIDA